MKSEECRTQRLAEYVDGELSGTERLGVSRHLDSCVDCSEDASALRRVGDLLRNAARRSSLLRRAWTDSRAAW